MMTGRQGQHPGEWLAKAEADDQPQLHSFAAGIRHDLQAATNGLTLPYSSGAVEGNVNRIKMIKRQMYGRAASACSASASSWPASRGGNHCLSPDHGIRARAR
jgi:Transposase